MTQLARRGFLQGLGVALAAPAIIRTPGLLMPVRSAVAAPILSPSDLESRYEILSADDPILIQLWPIGTGRSKFYRFPAVY